MVFLLPRRNSLTLFTGVTLARMAKFLIISRSFRDTRKQVYTSFTTVSTSSVAVSGFIPAGKE
jgi:hypothetical protein